MIIRNLLLSLSLSLTLISGNVNAQEVGARESSSLRFDGQEYSYKWSSEDLHEFTPGNQNVTGQWTDMVTINYYPIVSTGEDLSVVANAVLSNYEDAGGIVLGVESIPRTKSKAAEYIIAVVFGAPEAAEFALIKFQLHDRIGASIAYAHREYGADVGNLINDWMEGNGTRLQDRITKFGDLPPYVDFQADDESVILSSLEQAI
ncbi:MAG: hypothetical protein ACI9UN_001776 [Granulosicoccus sp.]|jgi:hypothetical protein